MDSIQKQYGRAQHNLAKALQGVDAAHQAEVLRFVVDWQIDPDNEFFLIFAAIGHLKFLIENAPEDWRQLFHNLYGELNQWGDHHISQLKAASDQTEAIGKLTQSSVRLAESCNGLKQESHKLIEELRSLKEKLSDSNSLENNSELIEGVLTPLTAELTRIKKQLSLFQEKTQDDLYSLTEMMVPNESFFTKVSPREARRRLIHDIVSGVQNAVNGVAQKASIWNFENADVIGVGIIGLFCFMSLSSLLGYQIGFWKARAERDYQRGVQIVEWNRTQLDKAWQEGKQKSTVWIVPPEPKTRLSISQE